MQNADMLAKTINETKKFFSGMEEYSFTIIISQLMKPQMLKTLT
jgi:hypothetical protein